MKKKPSRKLARLRPRAAEIEAVDRRLRRAKAALQHSDERLRNILENSVDVIYRRDLRRNRYDCVSPSVETLTGYTPEEFLSGGLASTVNRVHPDDLDQAKRAIQRVMAGGAATGRAEYRYRRKDGVYRWFADSYRVAHDEQGKPRYWVGTVRDITGVKRYEAALRRSRDNLEAMVRRRTGQLRAMTARLIGAEEAERERIGGVLHENLQQILVTLRYALECPPGETTPARQKAAVLRILDQAIRVARSLSSDLVPRMIGGRLSEGLAWLVVDVRTRFGLAVEFDARSVPEPEPQALRTFVYRAVRELLLNVAKHARVKTARLSVTASDGWLWAEVRDAGVGLRPVRRDTAGLGLFKIRETAAFLGGNLRVTSSRRAGTCATLVLPLRAPGPRARAAKPNGRRMRKHADLARRKISSRGLASARKSGSGRKGSVRTF